MKLNDELEPKAAEETAAEAVETTEDAAAEAVDVTAESPAEETAVPEDTPAEDEEADDAGDPADECDKTDDAEAENTPESDEKPAKEKKPFILQTPVIISIAIVLLALIGYFVYSAFFFHTPKGAIWMTDEDGSVYYFEFLDDGTFITTRGSIEECIPYILTTEEGEDTIIFQYPDGESHLNYTISGARILGNQEMTLSNSYGTYSADLKQVKEKINPIELPTEFKADEALLGEWELSLGSAVISVTFNEDGSMIYKTAYDTYGYSQAYNGTYTIENGQVSFTYCTDEPVVELLDYEVDGNNLYFLNMPFVRAGSDASADEK